MSRLVAVKNYGIDWYTSFGMDYAEAADTLSRQGVDLVLVQNVLDPLPTTAVEQQIPAAYRERFARYDDRSFRAALRDRGLRYYEAVSMFFNPALLRIRPDLRPVGANGIPMERFGWYVGLCPSDSSYLAERCSRIEEVVDRFQPDGIFLGWIRFPAFWELWMPETKRAEIPEYCFCERCLERFQTDTGHDLGGASTADSARILQHELRTEWTDWKCELIADVTAAAREAARSRSRISKS